MTALRSEGGLEPSVEQKRVEQQDRTNRFFPLVSNVHKEALPIHSDAQVRSFCLQAGRTLDCHTGNSRGVYLYVLEDGPVEVNGHFVPARGAAKATHEKAIHVKAEGDAELLLVDVLLL
jgi:redox-sensitive bicupin YhaK (pirin superfamily)